MIVHSSIRLLLQQFPFTALGNSLLQHWAVIIFIFPMVL